jgi:hypothetical protein
MKGMATVTAMATVMTVMTTIPPDTITILAVEAVIILDQGQDIDPMIEDAVRYLGSPEFASTC